jgi:molecular chaperone GrpE
MWSSEEDSQGPVIRDRRRIDPVTGQVRDAERQADQVQAGPPQRGPGAAQARPGRHAVSKPGGTAGDSGGSSPRADTAAAGRAAAGPRAAGGPPDSGGPGQGPAAGGSGEAAAGTAAPGQAADADLTARLAERTADLQRLQAEYANYRKRVERDRMTVREQALANVLTELLPVLDDIGRAREHGELAGGFKSVAESLESAAAKLGLISYGEDGEPFDPKLHEALMHSYSPDVTEPTAVRILQPGYKVGDRILRPARVAVAEPGEPEESEPGEPEKSEPDGPAGMSSDTGMDSDIGTHVNEGGAGGDDADGSGHAGGEVPSGDAGLNASHGGEPRAGGID